MIEFQTKLIDTRVTPGSHSCSSSLTRKYAGRVLLVNFILCLILSINSSPCFAGDASFDPFWQKFKIALQKGDKQTIVSMTKLPFLFDSKKLGKTEFLANYDKIFPKSISKCLGKEKPVKDIHESIVSYSFFCDEEIYVMEKQKNGQYLFTDIGVND